MQQNLCKGKVFKITYKNNPFSTYCTRKVLMYSLLTLGQKFGMREKDLDPKNHPYSITIEIVDKKEAKATGRTIYSMGFVTKVLKETKKGVPK